jgi:alkanesulfonate monooxygenase SsuD/methylene tetrahydromethanopterin reductase-like flavin-dependent oxidoreductase (luciferase family)
LLSNAPDPITGKQRTPTECLRAAVDNAVLVEELGLDAYGVGERHHRPFISSSPPVVLSHIAAVTSRVRLFTTVTLLSVLDPVRVAEDYATLDHLSAGRLELIIGKGNGPDQAELFGLTRDEQWDHIWEKYELLRRLWREEKVTWSGRYRPPLVEATTYPRPLQDPIRVWHGSATSESSVELAAKWGDPLFSANVSNPVEPYAALVRHYHERWAAHGHRPEDAVVGAGSAGYYAAKTSQEAIDTYRPIFDGQLASFRQAGIEPVFRSLEDAIERGSILVGSPEQIVDKVHRYYQLLGHRVLHLPGDQGALTEGQHRSSLELFASHIAPALRRQIPDPPWPGGPRR